MKRKHLFTWIKDKNHSMNESGKIGKTSVQKKKYDYDDFRNFPFGIMEYHEDFSSDDIIRIKKTIRELDECDRNVNRNEKNKN